MGRGGWRSGDLVKSKMENEHFCRRSTKNGQKGTKLSEQSSAFVCMMQMQTRDERPPRDREAGPGARHQTTVERVAIHLSSLGCMLYIAT